MKDQFGLVFSIGDTVIYGGRYGSTGGYVAVGTITKINERTLSVRVIKHSGHVDEGAITTLLRPDRAIIAQPAGMDV